MDTAATPPNSMSSVHDLRRRWKPTKERLKDDSRYEPTLVRFHRACSWLQRVEEIENDDALDAVLIYRWIALNSLYGQWDPDERQPITDKLSLPKFLDRILQLDADARIQAVLDEHRKLVMSIFEDEYLVKYFWEEPTDERARKTQKTKFDARTWYQQGQYALILDRLMERIYFLRCQLVHGAATFGGKLNRTAIRRCSTMLGHLMPAILIVIIDHGHEEDWGDLCYPPLH
jgi:hypothetical protein